MWPCENFAKSASERRRERERQVTAVRVWAIIRIQPAAEPRGEAVIVAEKESQSE